MKGSSPTFLRFQGPVASTSREPDSSTSSSNYSDNPVYGLYGSSFVSVTPDLTPFARVAAQFHNLRSLPSSPSDGPHRSPSSSSRSPGSGSSDEFDPHAPHLPRAIGGNFPGLYSSSGFDLLGVLARVIARPNPTINVGPVDASAAFIVSDARKFDYPIVYASDTFSKLTGYHNMEIVGRNCRFLQAPGGLVQAGSSRKYTDGKATFHMKAHIVGGKETQVGII
jgi:hypothetical protein